MNADWLTGAFEGLAPDLVDEIRRASDDLKWLRNAAAVDLFNKACTDLKISTRAIRFPFSSDWSALELGNMAHSDLLGALASELSAGTGMAEALADQIQLCRAFSDPERATAFLARIVIDVVRQFPASADSLRRGSNPGDVLDPFILSANFELLSGRDLGRTIESTTSHKILMKIEDLVGNLHQEILGAMRGNFRIPEPRGKGGVKETLDPVMNPFPGADVGQVPSLEEPERIRLFQIKSKTGSAKGGDGKRLGDQLRALEEVWGARTFYAAIVGNTLKGHRSKGAVLRASPATAVVVGRTALNELTQSKVGPELLLRVYQRAFRAAAEVVGYEFQSVVAEIAGAFEEEASEHGEDFLTAWLHQAVGGPSDDQDSRG